MILMNKLLLFLIIFLGCIINTSCIKNRYVSSSVIEYDKTHKSSYYKEIDCSEKETRDEVIKKVKDILKLEDTDCFTETVPYYEKYYNGEDIYQGFTWEVYLTFDKSLEDKIIKNMNEIGCIHDFKRDKGFTYDAEFYQGLGRDNEFDENKLFCKSGYFTDDSITKYEEESVYYTLDLYFYDNWRPIFKEEINGECFAAFRYTEYRSIQ